MTKFLKVDEFENKDYTITGFGRYIVYQKSKLCLQFGDINGVWVLSKSNQKDLTTVFGEDITNWIGKTVSLYKSEIKVKGRKMPSMKLKVPVRELLDGNTKGASEVR